MKLFAIPENIHPATPQYGAYTFIYSFSLILGVTLSYFTFYNFFITQMYLLAYIELFVLVLTLWMAVDLRISHNVERSSWLFVIMVVIFLWLFAFVSNKPYYSLIWTAFGSIAVFFLMGHKKGLMVTLVYLGVLFAIILSMTPVELPMRSTINIIAGLIVLTVATYYYELSRHAVSTAYEKALQEQRDYSQKLERLSTTDKLTQLYNRFKIDELLAKEFARAQRYKSTFSLILVDIDYFKNINDTQGHQVGDEVLVEFAHLLKASLRKSDSVGRWGGEEFLIIAPQTDTDHATQLAQNLREAILLNDFPQGNAPTASFGVSTFHERDTLITLLTRADRALYAAKNSGRNCVKNEEELD